MQMLTSVMVSVKQLTPWRKILVKSDSAHRQMEQVTDKKIYQEQLMKFQLPQKF